MHAPPRRTSHPAVNRWQVGSEKRSAKGEHYYLSRTEVGFYTHLGCVQLAQVCPWRGQPGVCAHVYVGMCLCGECVRGSLFTCMWCVCVRSSVYVACKSMSGCVRVCWV